MTKPLLYVQAISGFLQDETEDHGIARLHWELGKWRDNNTCLVAYSSWNSNWKSKAKYLALLRNKTRGNMRVVIIGYSWGAGYGAKKLAEHLHREGIAIPMMVLSDPVYRSWLLTFRWLAVWPKLFGKLFGWQPKIVFPPNVRELRYFVQTYDTLSGDECVIDSSSGKVIGPIENDDTPHVAMDDYRPFHNECLHVVEQELLRARTLPAKNS